MSLLQWESSKRNNRQAAPFQKFNDTRAGDRPPHRIESIDNEWPGVDLVDPFSDPGYMLEMANTNSESLDALFTDAHSSCADFPRDGMMLWDDALLDINLILGIVNIESLGNS